MKWGDIYWPGPLRDSKPARTVIHDSIHKDQSLRPYLRVGRQLTAIIPGPDYTTYVVPPGTWNHRDAGSAATVLQGLDELGIVVRGTPAATGRGILLDLWRNDRERSWHRRPNRGCEGFLKDHIVGGRYQRLDVDTDEDCTIDERDSWLQHFQRLPGGTAFRVFGEPDNGTYASWFVHCRVSVPRLRLSPVHLPELGRRARWEAIRGDFTTVLWREEIELARSRGVKVDIMDGYAWAEWQEDTRDWCLQMERLKSQAEDQEVKQAVKRCIAATISTFGSTAYYRRVSPAREPVLDTDEYVGVPGHGLTDIVRREVESQRRNMVHWYSYCLMQTRLALFRVAEPYAEAGTLVRLASDAVRVREAIYPIPEGFRIKT